MITNVKVDLTETELRAIASMLSGKPVQRTATRKEITGLVGMLFAQLVGDPEPDHLPREPAECTATHAVPAKPNNASYMRGWNAVKAVTRRMK